MRELKFRAWKMHYGKLRRYVFSPFGLIEYAQRHPEAPVLHHEDVNDIRDFMPNADVIEQYTGLKDKNGKEVYEGDILKFEDSIFEIGWLNKSARFGFCPIKKCNIGMSFSLSHSEVIGNIHENPELIKEKE